MNNQLIWEILVIVFGLSIIVGLLRKVIKLLEKQNSLLVDIIHYYKIPSSHEIYSMTKKDKKIEENNIKQSQEEKTITKVATWKCPICGTENNTMICKNCGIEK